jgi:hypothetical protein
VRTIAELPPCKVTIHTKKSEGIFGIVTSTKPFIQPVTRSQVLGTSTAYRNDVVDTEEFEASFSATNTSSAISSKHVGLNIIVYICLPRFRFAIKTLLALSAGLSTTA